MTRRVVAVTLSLLLAGSPGLWASSAAMGAIAGRVTVDGRPVSGMGISLVDIDSGQILDATSGRDGAFTVPAPAGSYVLTNLSQDGLSVGRAPSRVVVASGATAIADVDLLTVPVPGQAPQTAASTDDATILHDPIDCLIEGEWPLIDSIIQPAENIARARVYFRSALGSSYYFIEMEADLVTGAFTGKLPKPKLEASPITYYIEATTTDFGEVTTPEIDAVVIPDEEDCDGRVAAIGPPGQVTVFSAATGSSLAVPAGFAAGGLAIAGTTIALIAGGAVAAGVAASQVIGSSTTTTTTSTTTTTTTTTTTSTTTTTTTTLPGPAPTTTLPGTPFRGD
jgi:hypothetical protein